MKPAIPLIAALAGSISLASGCNYSEIRPSAIAQTADIAGIERYGPIRMREIAPGIWQHTSFLDLPGFGAVPSNGMLVVDGDASVLVDTAWTVDQTRALAEWAEKRLGKPIRAAVITHAHNDKMGGMAALHERGIATYAHALSNQIAPEKGLLPARNSLAFAADGKLADGPIASLEPMTIFYPGPGHAADNITVGVGDMIAFGGCLIKGADARSLGNLADADVARYAASVQRFAEAFPMATRIVMSHSDIGDRAAIARTRSLANELNE
ncbi:MAG: subclass B1 metallo-beta-lactamase [Pontixanthobacter sp.]